MSNSSRWIVTKEEQQHFIDALAKELAPLRAKVGISQGDLASIIGVSRQTYSAIENGKKDMSWSTYLSLILFFDYNYPTHQMIRKIDAFPQELIERFNGDDIFLSAGDIAWSKQLDDASNMLSSLDDQGLHAVKTVLKMEYERCLEKGGSN